jgi:hypothetical protein
MVEHIVEDSAELARRARGEASARGRRGDPLDDVYGWQELILNRDAACARCHTRLRTGDPAYRGLTDEPRPPAFLCTACIRRLREPAEQKERSS